METITNFFLGRWWSHLASVACLGFGVFCLLSIQRKNPLFKTKDRSKELMPSNKALVTLKSVIRGGGYTERGLKSFDGKASIYKSSVLVSYNF